MHSKRNQVVALIFSGFNILDLTGPSEVLANGFMPEPIPRVLVASATDNTTSAEGITVKRDISFVELLAQQTDGRCELSRFDVVLVPGAAPETIKHEIHENNNLLKIISTFAALDGQQRQRWLFSVCTGAGFLGNQGIFAGKTATTHWSYLDALQELCRDASREETTVVRKRWVDGGRTASGVRIVTSGGVSCGIDAALWITSQLFDMERASAIANGMDYAWVFGNLKATSGHIIR
jgi:transcriptional regulator GlxA family with amidase domain